MTRESHLRLAIADAQDRIASALGVSRARRIETVVAMLDSNVRRAPGYWLQLVLATGIATLGLALGSTAVVIGAMLVSPLMGPILELGMGFATGSSLLVIRSFLRVSLSVVTVTVVAAIITLTLPFHESTPEIAARTAPTLLDLLIAVFCALAAAYTTVRQTADTTAAAAGTAIGIALVPPLCVVGYGLGTMSAEVSSGAALLFVANFSAIVVIAALSFLVLGYNEVQAATLEHDYLEHGVSRTDRMAERAHLMLRAAFGSRYGMTMRLLVPAVALAGVWVPLSHALDEVAWKVRVRNSIERIVATDAPRAVQSALQIERRAVSLRLLVVGSPERAVSLREQLGIRIAAVAGVSPTVVVTAVPDAAALNAVRSADARTPVASADLGQLEEQLSSALSAAWPGATAGRLNGWSLEVSPGNAAGVIVHHTGGPLGAAAEEMLARTLSATMHTPLRIIDVALPAEPLSSPVADSAWVRKALSVLDEMVDARTLVACVTRPGKNGPARPLSRAAVRAGDAVEATLRATPAGRANRVVVAPATEWSIRVAATRCTRPDST